MKIYEGKTDRNEGRNNAATIVKISVPHSQVFRTTRQNISRETEDLKNTINRLDLTVLHTTRYLTTIAYIRVSGAYGTFPRIEIC